MANPLFVGLGIVFLSIGIVSFLIFPDAHIVTRAFTFGFILVGAAGLYIGLQEKKEPY